jgi:hypothetical protein
LPLAALLAIIGAAGFFAPFALTTGALTLPPSFEWPVGLATGVVTMEDGSHVVPVESASRIQVYDSDWSFLHGWQADTGGGMIAVRDAGGGKIAVLVERGDALDVFDPEGELISSSPLAADEPRPLQGGQGTRPLMTKPYLFPLWDPFIAWLLAALGMAIAAAATIGLSLVPAARLERFGIVETVPEGWSPPAYSLIVWLVSGLIAMSVFVFVMPGTLLKLFAAAVLAGNLVQFPRILWGFEIQGESVRIWFPFRKSANVVLSGVQLAAAQSSPAVAAQLTVPLANGKKTKVTAFGTARFRLLTEYLRQHVRETA